jgi:hypothetical protein
LRRYLLFIITGLILCSNLSSASDTPAQPDELKTAIYTPVNKPADQLSASLSKLYGGEVSFSIEQGQLLMRGAKDTIHEIQELLPMLDKAAEVYLLSINSSPAPPNTKVYGGRQHNALNNYRLSDGETLFLNKQVDQQSLKEIAWYRTSLEDKAVYQEQLQLRVTGSGQQVRVDISVHNLINNQQTTTEHVVRGGFDEWMAVATRPQQETGRQYSTRRIDNSLYVKVTKIGN